MATSRSRLYLALVVGLVGIFLLAACSGAPAAPPTQTAVEQEDVQEEEAEHEEEVEHEEEAEAEHEEEAEHVDEAKDEDAHMEEAEHKDEHGPDEHMVGTGHDVPAEAAAVSNPIEIDDEGLEQGASLYAVNCAVCHGETGEGDGPGADGLEQKPADLHEAHVQENSDGALFYIVSHGRPDTPMPAWDNVLSEDERWHLVNFLRTLGE
jgi:mono/diheme cytochrome c family protein